MEHKLSKVAIQITAFVDARNPGVVEGKLKDAHGYTHTFVDKVPLFTDEMLDSASIFPQNGDLECMVSEQSRDFDGGKLVRIRTIESTEGRTEFDVLSSQITLA